ncbi:hypothetical protein [Maritimibacter dapengensis]|uniref:Capsule polysaccharide biosynthesis protein n=1 Tax=Maritimibacter dapengensis TaxID=2836868 RepID=A0ABS6T4C5_9RHOB|nr:hypothetical protein [Maritimibacter dapengensis]MBV7380092.1 hypothetical protein [Maritimibacter dapengensis]
MSEAKILRIYLDETMLWQARQGTFGFCARVSKAFKEAGYRVELRRNSFEERMKSGARNGYSLFLMDDPFHSKALTMRKAYYFPFWRIEKTAKRWEFEVARKPFDPGGIDTVVAQQWFEKWRRWLFKRGPEIAEQSGMVYVALQGRLADHRSFQTMSPLDMVRDVQERAGDLRILLGLHPGETYSKAERKALEETAAADSRVKIQTGGMDDALRSCDLVVTQNSAAALSGFFFQKPAVLYGESDFHHQMQRVAKLGASEAWRRAQEVTPDYARYLFWFLQLNSIKADVEGEAEAKILATCRDHGWMV